MGPMLKSARPAPVVRNVAPNQGQGPLADFVRQGLQTLVFSYPCLDLLEQVLGHVDVAELATVPEDEVVGLMQHRLFTSVNSPPARGQPAPSASGDGPASDG